MSNDTALVTQGKGALGIVWLAAHWDRKLNRATVVNHNITLSVKAIMEPKSLYSLRISGFLLLGLSKLLDKKVEKILEETDHILDDVMQSSKDAVIILKSLGITAIPNRIKNASIKSRRIPVHFDNVGSLDLSSTMRKDLKVSRVDNSRYLARLEDITLTADELRTTAPDISTRVRSRNTDLEYSDSFLRDVEHSFEQNTKKRLKLNHEPVIARMTNPSFETDILGEVVLSIRNQPLAQQPEIELDLDIELDTQIQIPPLPSDDEDLLPLDDELTIPKPPEFTNVALDLDELDEAMTIHQEDLAPEYIIHSDPEEEERIRDLSMLMDLDDPLPLNSILDNSQAQIPIKLEPQVISSVISLALPNNLTRNDTKVEIKKEANDKFRSRRVSGLWREDLCTNIEDYEDDAGMDETHDIIRNTSFYVPACGIIVEDSESIFFNSIVQGMAPELEEFYSSNLKLVRMKRAVYEENQEREVDPETQDLQDTVNEPEMNIDMDIYIEPDIPEITRSKRPREEQTISPDNNNTIYEPEELEPEEVLTKKIKKEEDEPILPTVPEIPIKKENQPPEGPKLAVRTLKLLKLLHKKLESSSTISYLKLLENVHKRSTAAKSFYELMILSNKDLLILTQNEFFEDIGIWDRPRHNINI